ncbi:MAG: hypothetical protein ACTHOH_08995 [Lysobacteraceae bacterium]
MRFPNSPRPATASLLATALSLAAAPFAAMATAYVPVPPLSAMYETTNTAINDSLYTISYSEAYGSTSTYGYSGLKTAFYVERTPQTQTRALYRYNKGAPQTDHFYFTDAYPQDLATANSLGYVYEGIAGYLYTVQVPGSIPLYRLAKINATTQDRMHKYTTSSSEVGTLTAAGWTYEHIEGYVPQTTSWFNGTGFIPGFPSLPGGQIMTARCQQTPAQNNVCSDPVNFRNGYTGYRFVQSTAKPAGKTTQVMEFDLSTPDFMGKNEHIAIGLHGHWDIDYNNIDYTGNPARNHHALGIIIGATGCGVNVRVEAFWPTGNNLTPCNGQGTLQNNTSYHFKVTVNDAGYISYVVTPAGSGTPFATGLYDGNGLYTGKTYGFPAADTGYFIVQSTSAASDYTAYLSNLNVYWQ